jgi:hypothetical protein
MLAPRPTKLRSQRDINLWRIPPATLARRSRSVRDHASSGRPRQIWRCSHPSWLTMGSIDNARDPGGNDGRSGDRTGADFLSSAARPVDGIGAVWPERFTGACLLGAFG